MAGGGAIAGGPQGRNQIRMGGARLAPLTRPRQVAQLTGPQPRTAPQPQPRPMPPAVGGPPVLIPEDQSLRNRLIGPISQPTMPARPPGVQITQPVDSPRIAQPGIQIGMPMPQPVTQPGISYDLGFDHRLLGRPGPELMPRPVTQPGIPTGDRIESPVERPPFLGLPGPDQQPQSRPPEFAGMPDDLYNGMIAHRQRLEENARRQGLPPGVVMDNAMVKPWEQWMMSQQNQQRAPAQQKATPQPPTGMNQFGGMTPGQALGGELSFQGTRGDQAQQFPNLSANPNFQPGADMSAQQMYQQYQNQVFGNDTASVYTPRFATGITPSASPQTNPAMGPGASLTQPQPAQPLDQLGLGQSRLV